jgi:ATP-dependent Clp protease ATP-binding subunit ClpB
MNINNLTIKSQSYFNGRNKITWSFSHRQIENEHLVKGILEVDENVTPFILQNSTSMLIYSKDTRQHLQSFPKKKNLSGWRRVLSAWSQYGFK